MSSYLGQLTLRTMYEQLQNMMKMDPFGQIMSMIPGFGTEFLSAVDERQAQARLKKTMCIMDKLDYFDGAKLFKRESGRTKRVACGAGVSIRDVDDLLTQYSTFSKVMKPMGSLHGLLESGNEKRNIRSTEMQKLTSHMSKVIAPRVLNRIGGASSLSSIMQQVQGRGGTHRLSNADK
ncbi:unnamed protein product [Rotaria sordida]|uniref:Signal recognition particle SRP54 subunit M-domain domain-containing protein n=1 Tax=Rotaria sordida TaxID=392033 RepID=A0A815EHC8_9BILA|nr:unnamed protein product [Rotaria sordida]CAF4055629.1 unnamed protein product [Rotaria sordida]